jgi:hypothetical protein
LEPIFILRHKTTHPFLHPRCFIILTLSSKTPHAAAFPHNEQQTTEPLRQHIAREMPGEAIVASSGSRTFRFKGDKFPETPIFSNDGSPSI